jgi:hypothetical protein
MILKTSPNDARTSYSLAIEGMEKFFKANNELLDDHEDDYLKQSLTYEDECLICRQKLVTFLAFFTFLTCLCGFEIKPF